MNNGQSHANGANVAWNPESPFLYDPGANVKPTATATRERGYAMESPFLSEFTADGAPGVNTPHAEAFAELMESLRDEEFGEALANVADQASALAESPAYEGESSERQGARQSQAASLYLDRLATQSESAIQHLLNETAGKDLTVMSEDGLREYLESLTPPSGAGDPISEQFFGSWLKKARNAVSGAVRLARKGLSAVANVLPHTWILKRLLAFVRPMLDRVLKYAWRRLPIAIQPLARQLAARFLGVVSEFAPVSEDAHGEATTADARLLAAEFDTMVAGLTVEGESFENHANMEAMLEDRQTAGSHHALRDLDRARNTFVSQVSRMSDGEDPTPAVEQFVPAILAALKLAVGIIGRQKIVNFLSGYISNAIKSYIGQENANRLAPALVDAGLKLVNLEAESDTTAYARVASETLASTVEDTVSHLVQALPTDEWESESTLEAYTRDALETAVAANFPDDTVRGELHEANEMKGIWRRPRGQRYKMYTRIPSVLLTPQIANAIPSFRGVPLRAILRDRFGLTGPIRVHVHLYEAVAGTTPGAIARAESMPGGPESTTATPNAAPPTGTSATSGLKAGANGTESVLPAKTEHEFHPLTEAAAGLLLREPGLGRNVDERFLETPHTLGIGQRLYRLSIANARGNTQQRGRTRRIRARLDLRRGEATVLIYLSEAAAQEIAQAMRRTAPAGVVLNMLRRAFEAQAHAQSEGPSDMVQVHGESLGEDSESMSRRVQRLLGRRLRRAVVRAGVRALAAELDRRYAQFATEFDAAANAKADGVTIRIGLHGVPWLAAVRRVAAGGPSMHEDEGLLTRAVASHTVHVTPGYVA